MRTIDTGALLDLLERGAQIVEVLGRKAYREEHLPGAVNIPLTELDATAASALDRDRAVVAYCFDYQ
jgi:rhodanese-related sulfurtransferase